MQSFTAYIIECSTGCSCCSNENHSRGPYRTKADAKRRKNYYLSPDSKFCPIASQIAPSGQYVIKEISIETITNNRYIVNNDYLMHGTCYYVNVEADGTIKDNDSEIFREED